MSARPLWLGLLLTACAAPPPRVVVWAWEAPQDLRFLPEGTGVALLAAEVTLAPGQPPRVQRRVQPALLPPDVRPFAVVRLETHGRGLPLEAVPRLAAQVVELADAWRAPGVQVDFDALDEERPAYLALLRELRGRLGSRSLSMTALASWCVEETPWTRAAPVDEVVPQAFRMGRDSGAWRTRVARGEVDRCGAALGVATDEPQPPVSGVRTLYVFHPGAWTREAFNRTVGAWR